MKRTATVLALVLLTLGGTATAASAGNTWTGTTGSGWASTQGIAWK